MTKKVFEESKSYLMDGDQKKLAIAAGVTRQTVRKYLSGAYKTHYLDHFLKKLADKRKLEFEQNFEKQFSS